MNASQDSSETCCEAILISVGKTAEPVVKSIGWYRPQHVWYFCSKNTRHIANEIQRQLDWHPTPRFIEVDRPEELGPCYRKLRSKIHDILEETHVQPDRVLVDYTGGTKTMSAALVLVAVELFHHFNYVGGEREANGGTGRVVSGTEKPVRQPNPWTELAIREIERARDLWASCQFEVAAQVLRTVAHRVQRSLLFETIANLADAMAARHRVDFREAERLLGPLTGKLPPLFDGRNDYGLVEFVKRARELCEKCASEYANDTLLRELLDNALRTASQGRYEDAAARLYRAMEMQGQIWLAQATHNLFVNGRCKKENVHKIPETLKNLPFCKPDSDGDVKFSLEQLFLALVALGHPEAASIAADINLGKHSQWRKATEKRNASILAHGTQPVGADGFQEMKEIATKFLKFDLEQEANPIPPLNIHWFE